MRGSAEGSIPTVRGLVQAGLEPPNWFRRRRGFIVRLIAGGEERIEVR